MESAPGIAVWRLDGAAVSKGEWDGLTASTHNVLLIGTGNSTNSALALLLPHLQPPIVRIPRRETFRPVAGECRTLILDDVGRLSADEQVALRQWIDGRQERVRVVSTNTTAVYPLVASGRFDEALYYRLNIMLFETAGNGSEGAGGHATYGMETKAPAQ